MSYIFKRKLSNGLCPTGYICPQIWELENGDIVVVGEDITDRVNDKLPSKVSLGERERVVLIPRTVLESASAHIS